MKVALVHDDFIQAGGAESLFETFASIYEDAPIYTSLVDWNKLPVSVSRDRIRTSFIQKIPLALKFYKVLMPLYPLAFESFDFSDFDLVISSTTRFAKSVITKPKTVHICYINSLPRFLWEKEAQVDYLPGFLRIILRPFLRWLARWDKVSSSRPDYYVANSENIARKIKEVYGQDSRVIYPFADVEFFRPAKRHSWKLKSQDYYLIVSRLVKWKKIDLAVEAAKKLGLNLKIVGRGPDEARLKKIAVKCQMSDVTLRQAQGDAEQRRSIKCQIEFLGKVTRNQLRELYQNCQALIITQKEDFGIASVEAQACGRPVIAYSRGGQTEILHDGETGTFFKSQTADSLQDAIKATSGIKWSELDCRKNALRFSRVRFVRDLRNAVTLYARGS